MLGAYNCSPLIAMVRSRSLGRTNPSLPLEELLGNPHRVKPLVTREPLHMLCL
jgi:hypothetical protein